jgi:uncharacterized Zn finger protein
MTAERNWWASAWVTTFEERSRLDPNRMPRGLEYATSGQVTDLVLMPGEARARAQGRMAAPYEIRIRVRPFTDEEWDRVLDVISAHVGRAAALLDGELPPEIAQDVACTGLDLVPGVAEVGPRCTCPDDAEPCKHSAGACFLVADALDADPFVLLLLRGRTRDEVLAALRARRRAAEPGPSGERPEAAQDTGVDARETFAAWPKRGPVPAPPLPPAHAGHPSAIPVDPPASYPGLREDLVGLAADAARRAWELVTGASPDAGLCLDEEADLARRADLAFGTPAFGRLAQRSGVDGRLLARTALAWRYGGQTGLETLTSGWNPQDEQPDAADLLKGAANALRGATREPAYVVANRVTAGRIQVRLGRELLWYPYLRADEDWEPVGPPHADPARVIEIAGLAVPAVRLDRTYGLPDVPTRRRPPRPPPLPRAAPPQRPLNRKATARRSSAFRPWR